MKVLNLYAGIGGNRKFWDKEHTGLDLEITAVELNEKIAKIYSDFFPQDKMIVTDAHQYLLEHFKEYDFIWSSRPCSSHSKAKFWANREKVYPDMGLYEEIILLKYHFKGKWVVENVKPYYQPLIPGQEAGRHLFWANFKISPFKQPVFPKDSYKALQKFHGIDISTIKITQRKDMILRNCVYPPLGLHILLESKRDIQSELFRKG